MFPTRRIGFTVEVKWVKLLAFLIRQSGDELLSPNTMTEIGFSRLLVGLPSRLT